MQGRALHCMARGAREKRARRRAWEGITARWVAWGMRAVLDGWAVWAKCEASLRVRRKRAGMRAWDAEAKRGGALTALYRRATGRWAFDQWRNLTPFRGLWGHGGWGGVGARWVGGGGGRRSGREEG